jgi:hypothetical protein
VKLAESRCLATLQWTFLSGERHDHSQLRALNPPDKVSPEPLDRVPAECKNVDEVLARKPKRLHVRIAHGRAAGDSFRREHYTTVAMFRSCVA